jgi:hypothetical protein
VKGEGTQRIRRRKNKSKTVKTKMIGRCGGIYKGKMRVRMWQMNRYESQGKNERGRQLGKLQMKTRERENNKFTKMKKRK